MIDLAAVAIDELLNSAERRVMFFLLVPEQATQHHLDILSELAQMLSDKVFRETLLTATDPSAVHVALTSWEPVRPAA